MKRKFKHLCSTIQPIKQNVSTKRTITYLLNSLNIKRTTTYNVRNTGSSLGQVHKCGRVKQVNVTPKLSFWYSDLQRQCIYKPTIKKTCIHSLSLKKTTHYHNEWLHKHGQYIGRGMNEWMLVANWLLARKI